jgi:hypothetical protein
MPLASLSEKGIIVMDRERGIAHFSSSAFALIRFDDSRSSARAFKSDSLCASQRNSEIRSTYMHRKVKVLIARWLASRIETRTRADFAALCATISAQSCAASVPLIAAPAACGFTPHGLAKRRSR